MGGVNMRYQRLIIFILILMITCFADNNDEYSVNISTNNTFPFQGYFTDYLGRAYFGTVYMDFDFCSDESGANVVYGGTSDSGMIRRVKVYNGLYATKVSLPPDAFAKLAGYDDIWVRVYVSGTAQESNKIKAGGGESPYLLKPHVQLTAAPYAQGVRGLYYQGNGNKLKIGKDYRGIVSENNASGSLVIPGNVRVGTANAVDASVKLLVSGNMYASRMTVSGDIKAANGINGAVWN
jgi:hypothetical protein